MDTEQIHSAVVASLMEIAPEIDPISLEPDVEFRDQVDMDSMDMLNFVTALHRRTGIEVPDNDYLQLSSVDACVRYLAKHLSG